MNILVVNDDGIFAPGLAALIEEFSKTDTVFVCAPMQQCSAFSHHLTLKGRMALREEKLPFAEKAYALDGTPVDCCHSAIKFLFRDRIDFVVRGVNQ
jgi:5'-nucleotidase